MVQLWSNNRMPFGFRSGRLFLPVTSLHVKLLLEISVKKKLSPHQGHLEPLQPVISKRLGILNCYELGKTRNYGHWIGWCKYTIPTPAHCLSLGTTSECYRVQPPPGDRVWSPSCTEVNLTISSQCFSGSWTSSGFFTTKEMVSIFLKLDLSAGDWTARTSTRFTVHQTTIAPPVSGGPTEGRIHVVLSTARPSELRLSR